jgi:hypothetical protein
VFTMLLVVCFPARLYYYLRKTKRVVCPECRETADTNAGVCSNCSTDLDAAARCADDRESAVYGGILARSACRVPPREPAPPLAQATLSGLRPSHGDRSGVRPLYELYHRLSRRQRLARARTLALRRRTLASPVRALDDWALRRRRQARGSTRRLQYAPGLGASRRACW